MSFSEAHWNINRTQPKPRVVDKELQRLKTLKVVTKTFQETPPPTITPSPTASTVSRCYSPVPSEAWHSRRSSVYTDDGSSSVVMGPFRGRTLVEEPMPITPTPASATHNNTAAAAVAAAIQKQPSFHAFDLRKQRSFIVEEPLPITNNRQPGLPSHDSNVRKQSSFHQDYIRKQPSFHSEKSLPASRGHQRKEEDEEEEEDEYEQELLQLRGHKEQHYQKQQAVLEARIAELESQLAKTKKELELEREQHRMTKKEFEGECATLRAKVTQLEAAAAKDPAPPVQPSSSPPVPLRAVEEPDRELSTVKEQEMDNRSRISSAASGTNDDGGILEFTHQLDTRLSVSREIDHLRIWEPPKSVADDASILRRDSIGIKDGATFWRGMKKKLRV